MDILTRNLIWIFYSSGYESELKEILYDEEAVTSPDDVEVSVEDIEDEEKLEQLGKAILHFIFEKIIFCILSKYALCL